MNKLEKYAYHKYEKNKKTAEESGSTAELLKLCMEQDTLYKIIYRRIDARTFAHRAN